MNLPGAFVVSLTSQSPLPCPIDKVMAFAPLPSACVGEGAGGWRVRVKNRL